MVVLGADDAPDVAFVQVDARVYPSLFDNGILQPINDVWDEIGLARRETFTDHRHLIVYGQRTADDRLVFGGRGAPYHLGSRIKPEFKHPKSTSIGDPGVEGGIRLRGLVGDEEK